MVPIPSKTEKYKELYDEKKKRYKEYDGLGFGYVNVETKEMYSKEEVQHEIKACNRTDTDKELHLFFEKMYVK